ncbi:uncharacterized protein TNCT_201861 [Trichonephila clavata]|uniref:Uncharacterized protein n=1 Tax=Trichonephila clavata TaxID=2740835 RepID=A0A8X6HXD0_TRICU|nr:uncharacterized protein TNCT_201861 [Trichonephila clavata]
MNVDQFLELSREEKDEYAKKLMDEMKQKNERIKQRHAEVEEDRLRAEARNAAVTSSKASKKKLVVNERDRIVDNSRVTREREWDKGKINQDSDDWSPPRFPEHRSRDQRRISSDRKIPKKEENWRVKSTNLNKDRQNYFQKSRPSGSSYKYQDSSCQGASGFRSDNVSNTSRSRGRGHRLSRGTYKHFQTSKLDDSRKKSLPGEASSRSPKFSEHEVAPITYEIKAENDRMWLDDGTTEVQNKQSRVEKWVKSINLSITVTNCDKDNNSNKPNESAGDNCSNEAQTSKEHTPLKNSEGYEDPKNDQGSRGNYRSRGNRTLADEKMNVGSDNKYQRDMGKNFGDKYSMRRESDISDRTSSMKESDYHDCSMDKFNKASGSKSSNRLGNCQDGGSKHRYVPEAKPFQKQLNIRNWGKDKFYKPRSSRPEGTSGCQEAVQKSNLDFEYTKNMHQRYPNSYAKDKLNWKNTRKSDSCGYDEQAVGNRLGSKKLDSYSGGTSKCYKWKNESKFVGHSERFEDNLAADYNTRSNHKNNYGKSSPKRNFSNTVKSIETSSTSKNIKFNSNDDGLWNDCENSSVPWNVGVNDGNPMESRNFPKKDTYEQNYVPREFNSPDDGLWGDCENSGVPWNVDVNDSRPMEPQNIRRKKTNEQNYIPKKTSEQYYIKKKPGEQSYVQKQLNCPDDGLWNDCENSGVAWNVDINDSSQVESRNFRRKKTNEQNYINKTPSEQSYVRKQLSCPDDGLWDDCENSGVAWNVDAKDSCSVEPRNFRRKANKQNYIPKKPSEQNYFPKKPGEQCYVPKKLNCPDDGLWGDCENSGVAWNVDVNDSSVEPHDFPKKETDEQRLVSKELNSPDDGLWNDCENSGVAWNVDVNDSSLMEPQNFPKRETNEQVYISNEESGEQNYAPEDLCERNYDPEEHCERNYDPEEHYERNYDPEEHCERNYDPEEHCERNYDPEEHCERNYDPEEHSELNYAPEESCEPNYDPDESSEPNYDPDESCESNYFPEEPHGQNCVLQKPGKLNFAPEEPCEPIYFPEEPCGQNCVPQKPGEPNCVPQKPGEPNFASEEPCEPNYAPDEPCEPNYFPEEPCGQNCVPQVPGEPDYGPEEPCRQNCIPQEPGEPNCIPQEPGEPNYAPEEPCEPDYSPKEPCELNYAPEEPCEPDYSPKEPCEPYYAPEKPCGQNCVSQEPGEPNYAPEEPSEQNCIPEDPCEQNRIPEESCGQNYVAEESCGQNHVAEESCGQNHVAEELYDPEDPCEYIYDVEDPYEQNFVPEEFDEQNFVPEELDEQNFVPEEFNENIYDPEEKSGEKNYVSQEPVVQNYISEKEPNEKNYFQDEPVEKDFVPQESVVQNCIPDEQNYVPETKTSKLSNVSEKETGEQRDESEEKTGHENVSPIVFSPPRIINWAEESELYFQRLEAEKELELMNSRAVESDQELYDDYITVIESKEEGYESTRLSVILTDNKINEWDADSDVVKPLTSQNAWRSEENKAVDTTENKDALLQADINENKCLLCHEDSHIVPEACNLIINLPPAETDLKNQSCSFKIDSQISCKQKSHVENDTVKHLCDKFTDSSSQNVKNPSVEEYSESTVITTGDSCSTTSQENIDLNNKAGVISLSEDGGLSSVSEGKNNNRSSKRKNKKKRKASSGKK